MSREGPAGRETAVTFNIDLSEMRRERIGQMGVRAAMAFALLGLGGAAMVPGFGVYDIVALAGGSVAAGGIFALERRRYLESRSRVALAPERFLDLLVAPHGRRSRRESPAGDRERPPPLSGRGTRPGSRTQNDGVARPSSSTGLRGLPTARWPPVLWPSCRRPAAAGAFSSETWKVRSVAASATSGRSR